MKNQKLLPVHYAFVLSILLAVAQLFLWPNPSEASTGLKCISTFKYQVGSNSSHEVYRPEDPILFAEIIPGLNLWKALQPAQSKIEINSEKDYVEMSGSSSEATEFQMQLKGLFKTTDQQSDGQGGFFNSSMLWGQDVGKGLRLRLGSNQEELLVDMTLQGYSRAAKESFTATVTVPIKKGSNDYVIPWEKFILDNAVYTAISEHLEKSFNQTTGTFEKPRVKGFEQKAIHVETDAPDDALQTNVYRFPKGHSFQPDLFIVHGIQFKARPTNKTNSAFKLRLHGSIHRDFDLNWIHQNDIHKFNQVHAMNLPGTGALGKLTQFMAIKLQDKESQDYALDIILQGEEALRKELEKYGFRMEELPQKLTADDFFFFFSPNHPSHKNKSAGAVAPIEKGSFANYHGRFTHPAQILTLVYNADPKIVSALSALHNSLFPGKDRSWRNIWNIFFDAPGDYGPNCPRWWAKKFQQI